MLHGYQTTSQLHRSTRVAKSTRVSYLPISDLNVPCQPLQPRAGCPIQAPLGWESTNLNPPLFNQAHLPGAPSKLRLGGIQHKPQPSLFNQAHTRGAGCPIQAPLGWESTNLNHLFSTRHISGVPGAPSKLRLGGKAQTSTHLFSTRHIPRVPHPSSAWVGKHKPQPISFQPGTSPGCPIQAPLGWESTNLNPSLFNQAHPAGCPIQAPLGWESTNLNPPLFNQAHTPGAPSKLRLGGKAQTSTHLFSTRHIPRVPHPSSAWVGIVRFSGRQTLAPVARLGSRSRSKPTAPAGGVRKPHSVQNTTTNPTTPERRQAPPIRNPFHPPHSKGPILSPALQIISTKSLYLS